MGSTFNRRTLMCTASAAVATGGFAATGRAALVISTTTGGGGTQINDGTFDSKGNGVPAAYFESDSQSGATAPADRRRHGDARVLQAEREHVGCREGQHRVRRHGRRERRRVANLPGGTVVGPKSLFSSTDYYTNNASQNSDLAYIDTTTGANYTPAGNTADQFSLNTPAYFGISLHPAAWRPPITVTLPSR